MVAKHADITTILFETEFRQILLDDLEELESFLKQRQAEMTSKDQSFFSVYQDTHQTELTSVEKETEKLRNQTDAKVCQSMIKAITDILRELQDEKFSQTLQIRAKPDQTIDRIIRRIKAPLTLRDKQNATIQNLKTKVGELDAEISEAKTQIE